MLYHLCMWRIAVVFVLSLMSLECSDPRPEPERFGVVKIAFAPSLSDGRELRVDQQDAIRPLARELDALGPDFIWVSAADPEAIVIRPEMLPAGTCGSYRLGELSVAVDPACTAGYSALRKAAAHEIVHALLYRRFGWSGHLCWYPINSPVPNGCHRTILCRACLMSPELQGEDVWGDSVEDYAPSLAIPEPQSEDIALVRLCFEHGRCE